MRRTTTGLISLALATGLGLTLGSPTVGAPAADRAPQALDAASSSSDELSSPFETKRRALKDRALRDVINGKATPVKKGNSTVVKLSGSGAKGGTGPTDEYVELSREGTDKIFVILAEFGNERHPSYPDQDTHPATPGPAVFDGPLVNQIPEPDRTVDNSTVWQADYNRDYFENLYFGDGGPIGAGGEQETVKQWFERQSSGRYSIDGTVSDWVKVRYNEARYGRSNGFPCAGNVCNNTWRLVQDAANQWVADQKAAGKTTEEIATALAEYDVWDRYDADGDGNFNESDGFIDHFQIVHAGGDQADGDPWQGEDAIWSHRWYAQLATSPNGFPGTPVGDTGLWIGDYTIQPENGGMSVFAHEYVHDLGLPDLYDTSTGADNGVNWWSMMAQSRQTGANDEGIGTRGSDLGAWEKVQLGWLNYQVVQPTKKGKKVVVGPHEYNTDKPQAIVVPLPKKAKTTELIAPFAGTKQFYGGRADGVDNTLVREVTLGGGASTLTFQTSYAIEDCGCDFAYVEVNDGSGWTAIKGTGTRDAEGNAITGFSGGGTSMGWVASTFDLSAYANKTVQLRFRYHTDGGYTELGWFVDDIKVVSNGATVVDSGAEAGLEGWTTGGWSSVGASIVNEFDNFYLASYRNYLSFDKYLKTGPYNFGWLNTKPDFVEHFPYQDGLLISYWDTSQSDNNTGTHPGEGEILPIDANPAPVLRSDGGILRPRVAGYDAPFSTQTSDSFTYHLNGNATEIVGKPAQTVFSDANQYWFASTPTTGVKVPNNGVNIGILNQYGTSMQVNVWLR